MPNNPYLPLWTDAYLADTTHLTDSEHGIYLQLMMHAWRTPGCRLPNDDEWLARKLRRSVEDVLETVRPVISEFFTNDGNWIKQKRLSAEYQRAENKIHRARAGAKAKWDKKKDGCSTPANSINQASASTSTSTSTPTKEKNKSKKKATRLPEDWQPTQAQRDYAEARELDPDLEAENFRDYWLSKPPPNTKLDWNRTWQMHCRNAITWGHGAKRNTNGANPPKSQNPDIDDAMKSDDWDAPFWRDKARRNGGT